MNIKDAYIYNGTAVLKDIKVENSVLKKILAGKDAKDAYLDWETVCDLAGIKTTATEVADSIKVLGYNVNSDAPTTTHYLTFVDSNNTSSKTAETLYSSRGLRFIPRYGSILEGNASQASGLYSHAEGYNTYTWSDYAHVEGNYTRVNQSTGAHAEGYKGYIYESPYAHVEGYNTSARYSYYAHAEGYYTQTTTNAEHAEGRYNYSRGNTLHSVGIGNSDTDRINAFEIQHSGTVYMYGVGGNDGKDTLGNSLQAHLNTSLINEHKWAYIFGETPVSSDTVTTIYLDHADDYLAEQMHMTTLEFLEACANDELPEYNLYSNSTRMVKTQETLEYEGVEYIIFKEDNGLDPDDIGCPGHQAYRLLLDPNVDTAERLNSASIYGGGNGSYGFYLIDSCASNSIYDGQRSSRFYLLKVE